MHDGLPSNGLLSRVRSLQTLPSASLCGGRSTLAVGPTGQAPRRKTSGWSILPSGPHLGPGNHSDLFASRNSGSAGSPTQPARLQFLHQSQAACLSFPVSHVGPDIKVTAALVLSAEGCSFFLWAESLEFLPPTGEIREPPDPLLLGDAHGTATAFSQEFPSRPLSPSQLVFWCLRRARCARAQKQAVSCVLVPVKASNLASCDICFLLLLLLLLLTI